MTAPELPSWATAAASMTQTFYAFRPVRRLLLDMQSKAAQVSACPPARQGLQLLLPVLHDNELHAAHPLHTQVRQPHRQRLQGHPLGCGAGFGVAARLLYQAGPHGTSSINDCNLIPGIACQVGPQVSQPFTCRQQQTPCVAQVPPALTMTRSTCSACSFWLPAAASAVAASLLGCPAWEGHRCSTPSAAGSSRHRLRHKWTQPLMLAFSACSFCHFGRSDISY